MFSNTYFIAFQELVWIYYLRYVDSLLCLGEYFFSLLDQKGAKDQPKFYRDVAV